MPDFKRTTESFRQGARTLPREFYTSDAVLAEERERIFARGWNCVGRGSRLAAPGDFITVELAGESVIVVREKGGGLNAFFNVCRHRGTRICRDAAGHFNESIQCPYHAWTYGTDGQLIGAPHMQDTEGFDKAEYPLHRASLAEWEGFVFVNLAGDAEPFERAWAPMLGRLARYGLTGLAVGHRVTYEVNANWKLVFQNYSECLHCPTIHPKLAAVLPYQSGANDLTEGAFLGGYMEIKAPNQSATMSGRVCGRSVSDAMPEADQHRAFYYSLMPNMLLSLHPDYVNYYLLHAVAVDRTVVESEWLFHPDTIADPNNNMRDGVEFWDLTNRQDWDIVEQSQLGIGSRRYAPGPYSSRESIPAAWDLEYLRRMGR
ncbi:MAG: aromatic ring-hydroxylating dioxygenase subunit alpha [Candidatus Eisenbacteria bacterium]|uniref:Aromatic ring-hydroxylating dioxygenase subunit alpha n=1 Tax=Eiseniibacteriota bacterium TaxID=2212470 RepID=A0A849SIF1_UNCEI|nr:aromatic ring-hydroxylating dioxygenase subunit alpha [Candidatus Eisenbacteria bacterium]